MSDGAAITSYLIDQREGDYISERVAARRGARGDARLVNSQLDDVRVSQQGKILNLPMRKEISSD